MNKSDYYIHPFFVNIRVICKQWAEGLNKLCGCSIKIHGKHYNLHILKKDLSGEY